ncbi:PKD domain-containing protein [Phaeocystidibacter marisrubri]|uniref:T9SS type A sorting domain-containing protein n=2 Tax=Phaeocystidibacter marisrubri TaxID=1577780 RepID=A0A6L3ZJU3_9FLAO|nr:PKD domain-containing protein [Phaeocystidibacter marisrubri]KAB2818171.1 T9SS type A sorting domain-containing protein [Phaeocystidibacter marisrubri]GGH71579.1 hypothetical protein GCM10011318_14680 [Phaeocystidibacter marisrubri]
MNMNFHLSMKPIYRVLLFLLVASTLAMGQVRGVHLELKAVLPPNTDLINYRVEVIDSSFTNQRVVHELFTDFAGEVDSVLSGAYDSGQMIIRVWGCNQQLAFNKSAAYDTINGITSMTDTAYVSCVDSCEGTVTDQLTNNTLTLSYVNHPNWTGQNMRYSFSDGTTQSGANISKTFSIPGKYYWAAVHLGCVVRQDTVTISPADSCEAKFIVDTVNSFGGNLVIWNISDSTSFGADSHTYFWNFGDGNAAQGPFPTHVYSQPGAYKVSVLMEEYDSQNTLICSSYHVETVGMDANGDLIYKTGYTLNVMDPYTIGIEESEPHEFIVYPQPANDVINIESEAVIHGFSLFDLSGREVHSQATFSNKITINTNDCPSGMYVLRISSSNRVQHLKIRVE